MVVCLIKLLVYGEPIVDRTHSKTEYMHKMAQSIEYQFRSGDLTMAKMGYLRQLQLYGINVPAATNITWLECTTYTSWQLARAIIHRLPFGLWLSRKIGGLYCSDEVRARAMQTYKEIGWILHRLNQIGLMEMQKMPESASNKLRHRIHGVMITLYAVNMIESAEPIVNTNEIVEIYLNAMLRMKLCSYRLFSSYYLRKAKFYQLLSTTQQTSFDWIFTEHGYRFVSNLKLTAGKCDEFNDDQLEPCSGNTDPVWYIQQKYRRHLLTVALEKLLGLHRSSDAAVTDDCHYPNKQAQTLNNILTLTNHLLEGMSDGMNETDALLWIARIISATASWSSNDTTASNRTLYDDIDGFMRAMSGRQSKQKTLIKSFYMIFIGKREFVHCQPSGNVSSAKLHSILNHCNAASCLLETHLTYNRSQNNMTSPLIHLLQMLVCDWLLALRSDCWDTMQSEQWMINRTQDHTDKRIECDTSAMHTSNLEYFQMDLANLYSVFDGKPLIQSRVNLNEAIYRLMAEATPLETYNLLYRNIQPMRQTKPNLICVGGQKMSVTDEYFTYGERERATSMFFACKYLQCQVEIERAGLLTQAGSIFKDIGDINKANECYQLLNYGHDKDV